ncbi:hypothetical protein [Pleomorphomonas sp. NRK KF1]|uniref:hypothetical protein n=1 Tax=Pleomorphomonas sp. NRK KF1 TaxID=2943000 RepID=UPI0020449142|nr:hypothetical protein [Pleomorphomonas sp. NRK KF1]MCM5553284.1 hypothetical protein [Pleomorphomonas sp. NRK KF1]
MSSNNSSSDNPCDEQLTEGDLSRLRETARRLLDAIAAEPVPERLRQLATELGELVDRRREKGTDDTSQAD